MMPAMGGRDAVEVEALLTDRYLDSLLAAHASGADLAPAPSALDRRIREAADLLARALPRTHPSFRFEEALAARLASVAHARRLPAAAGAEGRVITLERDPHLDDPALAAYLDGPRADPDDLDRVRPLLIGGALTSAALSIAGAAFVAWRRRRPSAPMAGAVNRETLI